MIPAAPGTPSPISPGFWLVLPLATLGAIVAFHDVHPWSAWLRHEHGVIELTQFGLIATTSFLGFRLARVHSLRGQRGLVLFSRCLGLGALYIAGEEISWGQHVLRWETPATIGVLNDQNETNLHNMSVLFNQVPRALLELAVFGIAIVLPLASLRRPRVRSSWIGPIVPSVACLPAASIAIGLRLAKVVQVSILGREFPLDVRIGELEELFLYGFLLLYVVDQGRRHAEPSDVRAPPRAPAGSP